MINLSPTIDANHQEYHFNDSEVDFKCCGWCWHSKPKHPKEYTIDERYRLRPEYKHVEYSKRILANERLVEILKHNLDHDTLAANRAFERLRERINHNIYNGSPITEDKLAMIINIIHEVRQESINNQKREEEKHVRSKSTHRSHHRKTQKLPSMQRDNKQRERKVERDSDSRADLP